LFFFSEKKNESKIFLKIKKNLNGKTKGMRIFVIKEKNRKKALSRPEDMKKNKENLDGW
jgi:hypothetical protein